MMTAIRPRHSVLVPVPVPVLVLVLMLLASKIVTDRVSWRLRGPTSLVWQWLSGAAVATPVWTCRHNDFWFAFN